MQGKIVEIPEFSYADVALIEDEIFAKKAHLKGRIEGLRCINTPTEEIDCLVQPHREAIRRLHRMAVRMRVQIEQMGFENAGERPKTPEEEYEEFREELDPLLKQLGELIDKTPERALKQRQTEAFRLERFIRATKYLNDRYNGNQSFGVGL